MTVWVVTTTLLSMLTKTKLLAAVLGVTLAAGAGAGCGSDGDDKKTERWATTQNTTVKIDWDKVNEAYKQANGPEDLEKRINEIYEGDEVISIAVLDTDAKTQTVTGFFDKNTDGKVDEPEKIFTIQRQLEGSEAKVQTTGHGAYAGYHSPFMSIASGMLMGAMLSNMFMPSYMPMYTQGYTTNQARAGQLASHRNNYRAANPERFQKRSQTGRSYGGASSTGGGRKATSSGGSRGGRGFGIARAAGSRLLTA